MAAFTYLSSSIFMPSSPFLVVHIFLFAISSSSTFVRLFVIFVAKRVSRLSHADKTKTRGEYEEEYETLGCHGENSSLLNAFSQRQHEYRDRDITGRPGDSHHLRWRNLHSLRRGESLPSRSYGLCTHYVTLCSHREMETNPTSVR